MATLTVREAVGLANRKVMNAFSQRDAAAISRCYSLDGQLLPPQSGVVEGHAAIAAFWQAVFGMGITALTLETLEVVDHGDSAHEVGRYSLSAASGPPLDHGKYVVIWRLEGGEWKLHRDIWNTSVAPTA